MAEAFSGAAGVAGLQVDEAGTATPEGEAVLAPTSAQPALAALAASWHLFCRYPLGSEFSIAARRLRALWGCFGTAEPEAGGGGGAEGGGPGVAWVALVPLPPLPFPVSPSHPIHYTYSAKTPKTIRYCYRASRLLKRVVWSEFRLCVAMT